MSDAPDAAPAPPFAEEPLRAARPAPTDPVAALGLHASAPPLQLEAALDARRARDFAAGFTLTLIGVLASMGVAMGWLGPEQSVLHPLNAPHVWLPYAAGLWFLRRSQVHEESQQRLEDRWHRDQRELSRLAYLASWTDKELVARVILALARANEPHGPAAEDAGPAVDDISERP